MEKKLKLPGPRIPADDEIEHEIRRFRGKGMPEQYRDGLSFIRDLADSKKLVSRLKDDAFASQFQYIIDHHRIIYGKDGMQLMFSGEDSVHFVTASLRPFGEHYSAVRDFYLKPEPKIFQQIQKILKFHGYSVTQYSIVSPEPPEY